MAVGLSIAFVVMLLGDIVSTEYQADPIVLVIVGTMVLTLLGLEARDLLRGGGG